MDRRSTAGGISANIARTISSSARVVMIQMPRIPSPATSSRAASPGTAASADAVLRLPPEPCVYYPEATVHRELMRMVCPFMDALERFYMAWSRQEAVVDQPPKHVFSRDGVRGDWRVMPCFVKQGWLSDDGVIAAVKVIGTNEEERVVADKISVGKALLLNSIDHHVEAIFDVAALSSFRTAAISVLAYKHCAHPREDIVGLIGAGRIGYYTAAILRQWLDVDQLLVHDCDDARQAAFLEAVSGWFGRSSRGMGLDDVCRVSQSLFLATTSTFPLLGADLGRTVRFISSVGADADNLSELEPDILDGRRIVSESTQNVSLGDLRRWHELGLIGPRDIVPLATLMRESAGGVSGRRPSVFISTGTAVQDAIVCRFLHDALSGHGGRELSAEMPSRG